MKSTYQYAPYKYACIQYIPVYTGTMFTVMLIFMVIQGHKEVCHMHMIAKCKKCSQIVLVSQPICAWGVCGCGCVWVVWGGVLGQLVRVIHDAYYIYGHLQKKNNFHKYIFFFIPKNALF